MKKNTIDKFKTYLYFFSILLIILLYATLKINLSKFFNPIKVNELLDVFFMYVVSLISLIFINANKENLKRGFFSISFITMLIITLYTSFNLLKVYNFYSSEIVNKFYSLITIYQELILNIFKVIEVTVIPNLVVILYFRFNTLMIFTLALILYRGFKQVKRKYLYSLRLPLCLNDIPYYQVTKDKLHNLSLGYLYKALP